MFEQTSSRVNQEVDEKLANNTQQQNEEVKENEQQQEYSEPTDTQAESSDTKTQVSNPFAIRDKIMSNFNPPANSGYDETIAKITVDDQGNVLSVTAMGDNLALNESAVRAVRSSSPLPHTVGENNHTLLLKGIGNK